MNGPNQLIRTIDPETYRRLCGAFHVLEIERGTVVAEAGGHSRSVYFPCGAVFSAVVPMPDGRGVEAALVGLDGMAPVSCIFGGPSPVRIVTQVTGKAIAVPAFAIREEMERDPSLRRSLLGYAGLYVTQVSLVAACNRLHDLKERLAKWLLVCRDRSGDHRLTVTHEAISQMLGSRRAGVTVALHELREAGLIRLSRGAVEIVDSARLGDAACECYEQLRSETDAFARAGVV